MEAKNLIVFMSDGHDPRYLGSAGHPLMHTPALDRLADRGVRFSNAYTPCPICVPARASFATGRHVHETGCWDNAHAYDGESPGWAQHVQRAGYPIEAIGKMHFRRAEDPLGFDRQIEPMHIVDGVGMVWGALRDPFPTLDPPFRLIRNVGAGVSNYNLYDRRIANHAAEWLKAKAEAGGGPWVLYVGFVAPHPPFLVPREYLDLYPLDRVPLPKAHDMPVETLHPWTRAQTEFIAQDRFFRDDGERRLAYASYLALLSFVDAQIGFVLDALEEAGLAAETRILYTSDHGDSPGARGMWGKFNFYEESAKVPMILSGPDVDPGAVCRTPVSLVDVFPTVLDALAIPQPEGNAPAENKSLFDIAGAPPDPERVVLSQYHAFASPSGGYMLRKGRYKYHHYVGYRAELFDLRDDPEELVDRAADPAYAGIVAEMEALLRERLDPEDVDRRAKADQDHLIDRHGGPELAIGVGAPGTTPVPGYASE
ncbi:MAG: sulfatase-like hydrolase/transferase [Pseudomonadota bacterium]